MNLYPTAETWTGTPGAIAPADGNAASAVAPASLPARDADILDRAEGSVVGARHAAPLLGTADLGPNNERLEDLKPNLVHARASSAVSRRRRGRAAARDSAHSPGTAFLAGPAIRLVESQRHELAPAVRAALQRRPRARRDAALSVRHQFLSGLRSV